MEQIVRIVSTGKVDAERILCWTLTDERISFNELEQLLSLCIARGYENTEKAMGKGMKIGIEELTSNM